MSPDELHAEQIRRLQQDIRDLRAEQAEDVRALRAAIERADSRVGQLIMVLIGFAFTVAGSAVALALALGGPS